MKTKIRMVNDMSKFKKISDITSILLVFLMMYLLTELFITNSMLVNYLIYSLLYSYHKIIDFCNIVK